MMRIPWLSSKADGVGGVLFEGMSVNSVIKPFARCQTVLRRIWPTPTYTTSRQRAARGATSLVLGVRGRCQGMDGFHLDYTRSIKSAPQWTTWRFWFFWTSPDICMWFGLLQVSSW